MNQTEVKHDVELRLIDRSRNRFRVYGLTICQTLFGEACLRVVWGRIGHRRLRERSEMFTNREDLEKRREELLERRRRHGYLPLGRAEAELFEASEAPPPNDALGTRIAIDREIVEAHGLSLGDQNARRLVDQWHRATSALWFYAQARASESALDLEDVSTLAAMYRAVSQVA
jgi:predicted DNA-binding WGR domain protein